MAKRGVVGWEGYGTPVSISNVDKLDFFAKVIRSVFNLFFRPKLGLIIGG